MKNSMDKIKEKSMIKYLFVDIGGVLPTDGWSRKSRKLVAKKFDLNPEELENLHNQAFDTYELDKLTIEEYLNYIVY